MWAALKFFLKKKYSKTISVDAIGYGMQVSVGARFEYLFYEKGGVLVDGNQEEFGYDIRQWWR